MKTYVVKLSDLKHSWSANYLARREEVKKYFSTITIRGIDTTMEKTSEVNDRETKVEQLNPVDIAIIQKLIKSNNKLLRLMKAMREND
jgi:hypothetical protein